MKFATIAFPLALATCLVTSEAHTADTSAGKKKVEQVCQACHGMNGNGKTDNDARLAGQYPDYMVKALEDYASGARKNPIMMGIASTLTEADRANVAAYYAAQENGVQTVRATK